MGAKKEWKYLQAGHTIVKSEWERRRNTSRNEMFEEEKMSAAWTLFMSKRETNSLLSDSFGFFLLAFFVAFGKCVQHDFISREEISARESRCELERRSARMLWSEKRKIGPCRWQANKSGQHGISKQIVPFWGNFAHCHRFTVHDRGLPPLLLHSE